MKLLDLHCDTITKCMDNKAEMMENSFHNSFKSLLEFQAPIQVFAVYTDDAFVADSYAYTKKAINYYYSQLKKYKDYVKKFDVFDIEDTKVNAILALEGAEPINSMCDLEEFIALGVKIITLTWNRKNSVGCGALSDFDDGLTAFGKQVVRKMNEKNVVVDVSHLNEQGFKDVANLSDKPFIATHSNISEIFYHKRNLKLWQIKEIINSGGVVGMNIYPDFIGSNSVYDLLKHIEYILNINEKAVCLGCDFDGISHTTEEIKSVLDLKHLYKIISHSFGENIVQDIFYNNGMNFFENVWNLMKIDKI